MPSKLDDLHREVVDYLEGISNPEKVRLSRRWDKNKDYETYGLDSADYTALYKAFDPKFKALTLDYRLELTERWARTGNTTLTHLGVHLLRLSVREQVLGPAHFGFLDGFLEHFRGWGNVDTLCSGVTRPLLEQHTDEVIALLRRWNASENQWKRRASVVTFTRSTAESGRYVDVTLELCDNLIWDGEDLVRKGVGWALKDTMRADRERVLEYVKSLRKKGVSSTITLYAIRDLKGEEREAVLNIKPRVGRARN
ncbi:MAG: DNA alkylation repair protein [Candidatus Bathyarchaeota archaeon]|nr:MAG: DNA alkylation repair protein [Candidatus Bathyarchaeota archaeon]